MIGKHFSHYEILEKIGAGGMGEVYRARDSRLDRDVAIKIVPASFAGDVDRLARFQREAKLLASLNHPNIAAIHGFEEANSQRFLVLELVHGEDLSERIARGPISVNEAMVIARQIAEALEEAHGRGVVHRDLKPANIKITPDGKVKVLDFGLAKALDPDSGDGSELSQSPTIMSGATQHGVIMGTAAYMSPEQARGKAVDHRTDIWAFGCVLYEMLTAHACFAGDTITDILTGILHREPDIGQLPDVPPGVRRVIERCLRKDRRERMQHIGDVRIEINDAFAGTESAGVVASPARRRAWLASATAGVLGAALGVAAMMLLSPGDTEQTTSPRIRFAVTPPTGTTTVNNPTLSPNGRWLAYATNDGVILHDLERNESRPLPSLKNASQLIFFSPDSDWIGFYAGGKLQKVRVSGGVPVDLVSIGDHPGATWGSRHTIVYPPTWGSGLFEISDDGAVPRQITVLDREQGETGHWSPSFLPDGRHVLFTAFTTRGSLKHSRMELLDIDSGERTSLGVGAYPVYLTSGHIIYHRSGLYEMAPFDVSTGTITAAPRVVMENIPYLAPAGSSARYFSVSDNNILAYIDVGDFPAAGMQLLGLLARDGHHEPLRLPPNKYGSFDVSREGRRLATDVYDAGETDIWVYDLDRGTGRPVTRESNNSYPHWHPDNHRLAFISVQLGSFDAFVVDVDSGDSPTAFFTADHDVTPQAWTPQGALIMSVSTSDQGENIVRLDDGKASDVVATDSNEGSARVSSDGEWLAYSSDRSGRTEVYVQRLTGGNPVQVSTAGGDDPNWSRVANTLYFASGPTVGEIMLVNYEILEGRFAAGRPVPYLQAEGTAASDTARRVAGSDVFGNYTVANDGRLIVSLYETKARLRVHVALDAIGELERQATAER